MLHSLVEVIGILSRDEGGEAAHAEDHKRCDAKMPVDGPSEGGDLAMEEDQDGFNGECDAFQKV